MDSMRNHRIEDEDKGIAVERPIAVDLADTRAVGIDSDDEAHSERLEDAITDEASVEATAVSPPSWQDGAAAMARPDDASRLGDPIDIYFRDVGYGELLSRDEELALAKRIDEARQMLLAQLCRIPLIVECVSTWGEALREGRLRLSQFLDAPPPREGPEAAESDLLGDGGSLEITAERADLIPRLDLIATLGAEIAGLAEKRIAAQARAKKLSRRDRKKARGASVARRYGYCRPQSATRPHFISWGGGRRRGPKSAPGGARAFAAGRKLRHHSRGGD